MASTISAGTTAGTALNMTGDTTGNLAFQTGAGAYTQTMPNVTGTVMVNGPAFSAYQNALTTINTSTATKIALQLEEFDTANAFDSTTNYRFTPQVAGYYQVNGSIAFSPSTLGFRFIDIYKNGSSIKSGQNIPGGATNYLAITVAVLVYMNGSTDYIELYGNQNSGGALTTSANSQTYFQAAMVRSA